MRLGDTAIVSQKGYYYTMSEKARYWAGICYPENMIEDWQEVISEKLQLPYCYCVHNKDVTTAKEVRKEHAHIMLAFPNTTTAKTALGLLNKLSIHTYQSCCSTVEQVHNVRFMYEYLIHNTEDCKKKGKFLYKPIERICGNGFDIGAYEQISTDMKIDIAFELSDLIIDENFESMREFYMFLRSNYDRLYFEVAKSNSAWLAGLCKGNYLHNHQGGR